MAARRATFISRKLRSKQIDFLDFSHALKEQWDEERYGRGATRACQLRREDYVGAFAFTTYVLRTQKRCSGLELSAVNVRPPGFE